MATTFTQDWRGRASDAFSRRASLDRIAYRRTAALVLASAALAPLLPADLRARSVVVPPGRDAGPVLDDVLTDHGRVQ